MPTQHKDFAAEAQRLGEALTRIGRETDVVADIERRQFVEVSHYRESSGGNWDNDWFVAEQLYAQTCQRLKNLGHAARQPYFARVDFRRDSETAHTPYYIGKWGVSDVRTRKSYIFDWRSPVANLYYGGQVGRASYRSPGGEITGDMALKRIFNIVEGELRDLFDADVVTQDAYLHDVLADHADARLRDIVTTIQAEQNDIIRHNYQRPLIVQGVAGAGKTTVALHRITWLLYTYQQTMSPENLMVIAPSPLFLNYICAVLPELGAENVLQTTFPGLGELLTGRKLPKVDDSGTLLRLLDLPEDEREPVVRVARLKGSLLMKECVNRWFAAYCRSLVPAGGLALSGNTLVSRAHIGQLLLEDLKPFPLARRLPQLKKSLKLRVKDAADAVRAEVERETVRRANLIRERQPNDSPRRQETMRTLYATRDARILELTDWAAGAVDKLLAGFPKLDLMALYRQFLAGEPAFALPEGVNPADWQALCEGSLNLLDDRRIETADIAPLVHLNGLVFGQAKRLDIHHSVLDEAQDFSPFQFDLLKSLTQNASFTIVGDLAQGIHGYRGVTDWRGLMGDVFGPGNADYRELVTSYRNTVEIMAFAGRVSARFPFAGQQAAKPVLRHGKAPLIAPLPEKGWEKVLAERLTALVAGGMKTVAIVMKRPDDCAALHRKLKGLTDVPLTLYRDGDDDYRGGAMVLPAHMVKGLEFDAVLIADADAGTYPPDALHGRLLYVCCTRPLHVLECYHKGDPTPLLALPDPAV